MAVQNQNMVICTSDGRVCRWNQAAGVEPNEISISGSGRAGGGEGPTAQHRVFLDPTGNHTFICVSNGNNYYLSATSPRPKRLLRWQGIQVTAIAFAEDRCTEAGVRSVLVGSTTGQLYEAAVDSTGKEKQLLCIHKQLDRQQVLAVASLHLETFSGDDGRPRMLVLASTASPNRLYHFVGEGSLEEVFRGHDASGVSTFTELPGAVDLSAARVLCFREEALHFAMLTEYGIYHGNILFKGGNNNADNVILEANMTPFPAQGSAAGNPPISLEVSEFHFLLLRRNNFQLISRLTGEILEESHIDSVSGQGLAVIRDRQGPRLWMHTASHVYQLQLVSENRDIWKLYLEKARNGDERLFELALQHCREDAQRAEVNGHRADFWFRKGDYHLAADLYARSHRSFEAVSLRFVETGDAGALRRFLIAKLAAADPRQKTQVTMICTWLVEEHLSAIAAAEEPETRKAHQESFRYFLCDHKDSLDKSTTFQLLSSHGLTDEYLYYAQLVEDFERIVMHAVEAGDSLRALRILGGAPIDRVENLFYSLSPTLIEDEPEETIKVWKQHGELNFVKLIPALVRFTSNESAGSHDKPRASRRSTADRLQLAIQCLEYFIRKSARGSFESSTYPNAAPAKSGRGEYAAHDANGRSKGSTSTQNMTAMVKYLVLLYAMLNEDVKILRLLKSIAGSGGSGGATMGLTDLFATAFAAFERETGRSLDSRSEDDDSLASVTDVDLRYTLRVCMQFERALPSAVIYTLLGQYHEALDVALGYSVDVAKRIADCPAETSDRKLLWTAIAKYHIAQNGDANGAMALVEESNLLSIEEIVPHLPEFVKLDAFKAEICSSLERYDSEIDDLKGEIKEHTDYIEEVTGKTAKLREKVVTVSQAQTCHICRAPCFSTESFVFPCGHCFHSSCLVDFVVPFLSEEQRATVAQILEELEAQATGGTVLSRRQANDVEVLRSKLAGFIGADCAVCGTLAIESVDVPLIKEEDWERARQLW